MTLTLTNGTVLITDHTESTLRLAVAAAAVLLGCTAPDVLIARTEDAVVAWRAKA